MKSQGGRICHLPSEATRKERNVQLQKEEEKRKKTSRTNSPKRDPDSRLASFPLVLRDRLLLLVESRSEDIDGFLRRD